MDKDILISIVIPVKNGDYWLENLFQRLMQQTLFSRSEIIVIDSGSTDSSLEIIARYPVRLIQILPKEFNHGGTRNLGVREAKGEYVVMTVQDAVPVFDTWLEHLLNGFDDESIAGVCGQQVVPHELDKNPVEWFRPISEPKRIKYKFTSPEFERLSSTEKRQVCGWDDVTAMYRKKALLDIPFREVTFAEDALWARDVLLKGYTIVYNQSARVYHYHLEHSGYTVRRLFTAHYHFYKYFGHTPSYVKDDILQKLKDIKLLLLEKQVTWLSKWKWFCYNQRVRKEINKTVTIFYQALELGEGALEEKHNQLCGQVPQAIKPS